MSDQAGRDRKGLLGLFLLVLVITAATQWWISGQRRSVGEQIAQAAAPGDIQMLSSTTCAICTQARQFFQQHAVRFDECFIERDSACAARFEQLQAPGTPVIVVRGQPQLGFRPQRVLDGLRRS
jgi:glutaredoxin